MRSAADVAEIPLDNVPLPLVQLYRRALNAKTALDRHLMAMSLWEASVKLLGAVAVARFGREGQPDERLTERIQKLARPSLGDWWALVRAIVPVLAERGHAAYAHIKALLVDGRRHDDLPRTAGLDALLIEVLEERKTPGATVQLDRLFDRLVQHRNQMIGHGAPAAWAEKRHDQLADAIVVAVGELLGRLDSLAGQRLVYVAEVKLVGGLWQARRYELMGEAARRLPLLQLPREAQAQLPDSDRVYLDDPAQAGEVAALTPLHPLLVYDLETAACFFLNSRSGKQGRRKTDYLCYATGAVEVRPDLGTAQSVLLGQLLGMAVAPEQVEQWGAAAGRDEPAPAGEPVGLRTLGEYELQSELGQGGMGVVYRAWQPSLRRQVALKRLKEQGQAGEAVTRFRREIRALGKVDHPNLVKVFGAGSAGAEFFYTMELVEGAPLAAVCGLLSAGTTVLLDLNDWQQALTTVCAESRRQEKRLDAVPPEVAVAPVAEAAAEAAAAVPRRTSSAYLRHQVQMLRQVAEAAHALHEAGVLHRDIKPGNVLVTADGTRAVLMDLGLAQLADEGDGRLTRTRQFVGTLRYASPQQVLGITLDRRSDVYSLGATLWEVLALAPLFGAGPQTPTPVLMEQIQRQEPQRLSKMNSAVPRDLEAIVHKCLEKEVTARYATAHELATDLDRWLDGKPVRARRVRSWERSWKWAKRNPVVALLAAAVLTTLLAGTVVATLFALRAHEQAVRADDKAEQLDQKNQLLEANNGELRRLKNEADGNAKLAEERRELAQKKEELATANKALADRRFVQALEAYRQVVFDMQEKLANTSGTQEARKALLARAVEGLKKLVEEAESTQGTDHVAIAAHLALGDIFQMIDGQVQKAESEFRRALELARKRAADPKDAQAQRDLSLSYDRLGDLSRQLGDSKAALQFYQDSLEIARKLTAGDPKDAQAQRDLSVSYANLGGASLELGDSKAALQFYQDSLEIAKKLTAADPKDAQAQRHLSLSYVSLGDVSLRLGDSKAALQFYQDSLEIAKKRAAADPKNAQTQRDLSVSLNRLGNVSLQLGGSKAALQFYQDNLEILRKRAAADPRDAQAQCDLSISYEKLGDVSLQLGDSKTALQFYQHSLEIRKKLAAADPKNFQAQTDLVVSYYELGKTAEQALIFDKARAWLEQSRTLLRALEDEGKLKGTRYADWPEFLDNEIAFCQAAERALASLEGALAGPKEMVPRLLDVRVHALVQKGDHAAAAEAADRLAALEPVRAINLYIAARGQALCAGLVGKGKKPEEWTAEEKALREKYAAKALALLQAVKARGLFAKDENVGQLKTDPDLNALRDRDDFRQFVSGL